MTSVASVKDRLKNKSIATGKTMQSELEMSGSDLEGVI